MQDMMGMMKQLSGLQKRMSDMQAELDTLQVEGGAGGGLVQVTMTAKGDLKSVRIDPTLLVPEEREIVEDLLVAAHAEARGRAERLIQERMQSLTGGLPLPPGMKLF